MIDVNKLFFFDCEWVPIALDYEELRTNYPELADIFSSQAETWIDKGEVKTYNQAWVEKAHKYPEFCKIVCISYGYYSKGQFTIKSIYGEDEFKLLSSFQKTLDLVSQHAFRLCGYAIKRFDMPWVSKRMMANDIKPPASIFTYGQKPWDIDVIDLPELWGQGSMGESYTPFSFACGALGIPSSKDDISGKDVKYVYYNGDIERIKTYCEKDVLRTKDLAEKIISLMP